MTNREMLMSRQSALVPVYHDIQSITIVGCGSIGSNVADMAASMGIGRFYLIDTDVVSEENVYPARYGLPQIGDSKVSALANHLTASYGVEAICLLDDVTLMTRNTAPPKTDICVLSTDSLASRATAYNLFSKNKAARWYVDARIGGTQAITYCVRGGSRTATTHYKSNLHNLPDIPLPCGLKATSPLTKGMIPTMFGRIVMALANEELPPYMQTYDLVDNELIVVPGT